MDNPNNRNGIVLVSLDPDDPARWLKDEQGSGPLITEKGYGLMNEYEDIHTSQMIDGKSPEGEIETSVIMASLTRRLAENGVEFDENIGRSIKAASIILAGKYGDRVTLTGVHPEVENIIQTELPLLNQYMQQDFPEHYQQYPSFQNMNNINLTMHNSNNHPAYFLVGDGLVDETEWHQDSLWDDQDDVDTGGVHDRKVDDMTQQEKMNKHDELQTIWEKTHRNHQHEVTPNEMEQVYEQVQEVEGQKHSKKTRTKEGLKKAGRKMIPKNLESKLKSRKKKDLSESFNDL